MRLWPYILGTILIAALAAPALPAPGDHRQTASDQPALVQAAALAKRPPPPTAAQKTESPTTGRGLKGVTTGSPGPKEMPSSKVPLSSRPSLSTKPSPDKPSLNKSSPNRVTCELERICQVMKRPVREVVTECRMMKPAPDAPARRLCTEQVANAERDGPQLCRSAKICKIR